MDENSASLARIAAALERIAPPPPDLAPLALGATFIWRPSAGGLAPAEIACAPLDLLLGMDRAKDRLIENTRRFAAGAPANNALLWGARGTGKSALVKAVHAEVASGFPTLKLVEAPREALPRLPQLVAAISEAPALRVILFVDDLSFDGEHETMRALKPALDGGVSARGANIVVYATSNRRQIVARDIRENTNTDVFWLDTAEEKLALADRFGLWLGFHALDQAEYLRIVAAYADRLALPVRRDELEARALAWAQERAARSGRTAWQFILALAGELKAEVRF